MNKGTIYTILSFLYSYETHMYLAISMLPGSKFTISERNTFMSLAAPAAELYREIWSGDRDRQVMEAESKRKTERVCFKWRSGTE